MSAFLKFIVCLVVVVGGLLFALTFVDLGRFAPRIEQAAKDATGRYLKIAGGLHIGLSLTPSLVAEGVTFGNADWGKEPNMVRADKLGLSLSLVPLFSGTVALQNVTLENANIYLETDRNGKGNWELFDKAEPADAAPASGGGFAIGALPQVTIKNLALNYRDGQTGKISKANFEDVSIRSKGNGVHANLVGSVNGSPVSFASDISSQGSNVNLANAVFSVDGTSAKGDLSVSLDGKPKIEGVLESEKLDLTSIAGGGSGAGAAKGGPLFSRDPLPLEALDQADANLTLKLDELLVSGLRLDDVIVPIQLSGGVLSMPVTASYRGAKINAKLGAKAAGKAVTLNASSSGFNFGQMLKDMNVTNMISANADFGAQLSGRGGSLHAIASSLNGQTNFVLGKGTINSKAFAIVSDDLAKAIIPGGSSSGTAQLVCAISRFDFAGGVGTSKALAMETNALVTTGAGTIDLGNERLDLLLKPKPKEASLVSLAFPIRVSGPLTSPGAGIDKTSAAKSIATGAAGVALTGGLGALLPLMSTGNDSASASGGCGALATNAAKEQSGVLGSVGGAAESVGKGVGSAVDSVTKGIGGFFK
ncbi:MAG: AsmA family protein [Rhizobiales bacterium]|nr:AsmA family protein [Hyphomicrobiales bacterium]